MHKRLGLGRLSSPRARLGLAALTLAAVLGVMAVGISLTHERSKSQILTNFRARGKTSAGFVSTFLSAQAERETQSAQRFLSGRSGLARELSQIAIGFGSHVAGLFDHAGRVIAILPRDPRIVGSEVASRYAHLSAAESGRTAVSGVVPSAARHEPVVAIAVPYATPYGRRVFSPAYPVAGSVLAIFVDHAIAQKKHLALLVDAGGNIIAASPHVPAGTQRRLSPALARAMARASHGGVTLAGQPSTFDVAPVAGAPWRMVIAEPNSTLFASISGWALWLPWGAFSVIAILALMVLSLFSRSLVARARLETLSAEALEASRLKSEFVASISHEIRTPLNGIIGMTELLRGISPDPLQIEYLGALETSGEALLGVVSDVLDFSKIEAGFLELDCTNFELRLAIDEACQMLAGAARAKGLAFNQSVAGDVPITVHGDRARLRQILLNLLSNAVKFTASGAITVRVRRDVGDRVYFSVSDTGVGIASEQAPALFEAFAQADQSTTRQYGGTGLGLAISRQLAELMGGQIGAEPGQAGGSTFWFFAELRQVHSVERQVRARQDPEQLTSEVTGDRGLLVLIAEDNQINRTVIQALLGRLGLQTAVAHDGREAIEMAAGHDYDAIFMDCLMPETDGFQATREIRQAERGRHVPIIAMTALSMPGDRERCMAAGMDDYLSKPIRSAALEAAVERCLPGGGNGGRSDAAREPLPPQPVEDVLDQAVVGQLRESLPAETRTQLIDTFEKQYTKCLREIAAAVGRDDREEVRRTAHLLKGSSASLGAMRLRRCCERLEHVGRSQDRGVSETQIAEVRLAAAEATTALRSQLGPAADVEPASNGAPTRANV
jgi:signal transduction histidine kinase/CheY-like chemotaxis protein/HPt (histidine-containing phosphotransfer) domain-containing protein